MKELAKRKEPVYIIPRNMITYTAFMSKKLRFSPICVLTQPNTMHKE